MAARLDIEIALHWRSRFARHLDRRRFAGVDPARDRFGDITLAPCTEAAAGTTIRLPSALPFGARDDALVRNASLHGWRHTPPLPGRHYPRGLLNEFPKQDLRPFRVLELGGATALADFNPPPAGIECVVEARVLGAAPAAADSPGGSDLADDFCWLGPGMQAPTADFATDFATGNPFARADETPDDRYYARTRLVDHLDDITRAEITAHYRRLLQPGMTVLDLMASWNSHLPPELPLTVSGLGMNAAELAHNPRLAGRVVHDLNARPLLPFADASFDAALCALSFEYLIRPAAVVRDLARVLKRGAPFVVTFSDRWFPPKAIRLWSELHAFERIAFVIDVLHESGQFDDIESESLTGLPAPKGYWRPQGRPHGDPLFAVTCRRK